MLFKSDIAFHWVAKENSAAAENSEEAIAQVHQWSDRKRQRFKPEHIRKAWQHLRDRGWFSA